MASSSSWKLFSVLTFLVGILSSSNIVLPTEARQASLFFSKYVHAATTNNPNPISQISQPSASSPALSPAPAPAAETQNGVGYGLWGAGSGMVVPPTKETTTTTNKAMDPTYKDDDELEAALNADSTSTRYSNDDKPNNLPNGYSSSSNYEDNVYSATTTSYNDDDNKQYNPNSYSSKYENSVYPASYSKQYKLGGAGRSQSNNNNNGNSFATNYNTDAYYPGNDDLAADDDSNSNTNQYKLGNAQYVTGSQSGNNNNQGNSFDGKGYYYSGSSSGNSNNNNNNNNNNGYEAVERQGMSDTRFVEGGKYSYNLNDEENKEMMMSNYPVNYHNNRNQFGRMEDAEEEEEQVNWP